MDGDRGKRLRRRHSTASPRFNELVSMFSRVTQGMRPTGNANGHEALRNDIAGERRGTAAHRSSARKGGGQ